MKIFKFAIPLAAVVCLGAFAPLAESATPKRSSSSSKAKSSSSGKKSTKKSSKSGKSSKSAKSKSSKSSSAKSKGKSDRRQAKAADASPSWIDELPEVELPEAAGPAEAELLDPVVEADER